MYTVLGECCIITLGVGRKVFFSSLYDYTLSIQVNQLRFPYTNSGMYNRDNHVLMSNLSKKVVS